MIILSVHTTSAFMSVAVTDDDRVLSERVLPPPVRHLENLVPLLREIMAGVGFVLAEVDVFAVARGPGSFSGVRVGIATVKGLGLALGKPVIGVSSLATIAWQALANGESGITVIDARRGEIYAAQYMKDEDGLSLLHGPMLIPKEALAPSASLGAEKVVLCGDHVVEDLPSFHSTVDRRVIAQPSAAAVGIPAWQRLRKGAPNELHTLTPLYIRRSDAEENRRSFSL